MKVNYVPFTDNGTWLLSPNHVMSPGHFLKSKSGQYTLSLRSDANLVLSDGSKDVWVADANQPFSDTLPLHKKSSKTPISFLVSHSGFLEDPIRKRKWRAGATDNLDKSAWFNSYLSVQNDGNLLIMDIRELWHSNPALPFIPKSRHLLEVEPDVPLIASQTYKAGPFNVLFQADGNLVISDTSGKIIWTSSTENRGATVATMQSDGNFVIKGADGGIIWHTKSGGNADARLAVQENGKVIIIKEKVTWGRFGFTPGRRPYRGKHFPEKELRDKHKTPFERDLWQFDI